VGGGNAYIYAALPWRTILHQVNTLPIRILPSVRFWTR